jgi:hypothetical protein
VEQLMHQLRLRRWWWQMKSCPTQTKTHSSERDLGRPGLPARTGPDARLLGVGGTSLSSGSRFCRHHAAMITAVVEWRLMIKANTCRTHWQNGIGNENLEIMICKKFDQISQILESN